PRMDVVYTKLPATKRMEHGGLNGPDLRVPLLMVGPGIRPGVTSAARVQTLSIAPTLATLLRLQLPGATAAPLTDAFREPAGAGGRRGSGGGAESRIRRDPISAPHVRAAVGPVSREGAAGGEARGGGAAGGAARRAGSAIAPSAARGPGRSPASRRA